MKAKHFYLLTHKNNKYKTETILYIIHHNTINISNNNQVMQVYQLIKLLEMLEI